MGLGANSAQKDTYNNKTENRFDSNKSAFQQDMARMSTHLQELAVTVLSCDYQTIKA